MKLLALETSTHMLSVALSMDNCRSSQSPGRPKIDLAPTGGGSGCYWPEPGVQIIQRSEFCVNGGSDRLLPWVQQVLAEAGISLHQLDAIAFGAGPGSFTGLRMACGVAQGLAYGADLPVIPVVTLAALALSRGPGRMLACLDARMNEVYCAAYEVSGDEVEEIQAPLVCPPELLLLPPGREWKGCGDGFASYADALAARLGDALSSADPQVPALAPAVARLAARQFYEGRMLVAADAVPLYVRDKVALTTRERLARGGSK